MKKIFTYLTYVLGGFFVLGLLWYFFSSIFLNWSFNQKEWIGSYYTDAYISIKDSKTFDTLEECQAWGDNLKSEDQDNPNASYNCGRDCKYTDETIVSGKIVKQYDCQELIEGNQPEEVMQPTEYTSKKGEIIKLFAPIKNEVVTSPLDITGQVRGSWSFEGSFYVELNDDDGNSLTSSTATLQGDWKTEEYVQFVGTLFFEVKEGVKSGKLVLIKDNPSGLPENGDLVEIPVRFVEP